MKGNLNEEANVVDDLTQAGHRSQLPESPIFEATLLPAVPNPFSMPS